MYDVESGDMWSTWSGGNYNYNIYNSDNTPMQYVPGYNPSNDSGGNFVSATSTGSPSSPTGLLDSIMGNMKFGYNQGNTDQTTQRVSGSSGGGGNQLYNSRTTQSLLSGGSMPTYNAPTFNLPLYDYGRIRELQQQEAGAGLRKLESGLTAGMAKINATDNPYMQSQGRKQLLAGYGSGLSDVMSGAGKSAMQLYGQYEYNPQVLAAQENFKGQLSSAQNMFQSALQDYLKSFTTVTTTERY